MLRRADNGLFVTFEGGEGSGKTTLIEQIFSFLTEEMKCLVVKSREPGGTAFGTKLRSILLEEKEMVVPPIAELLLFLTDRAYHVERLIRPSLENDMVVLCDRFNDSSIAYQGAARFSGNPKDVEKVCDFAVDGFQPDITFLLDLEPEEAFRRIKGEKDKIESAGLEFHKRVREGYLDLAKKNPKRICVLDAGKSSDEVYAQAKAKLKPIIEKVYGK